jgi:adhesin/invasin
MHVRDALLCPKNYLAAFAILVAGCSAGGTGGDYQAPPPSSFGFTYPAANTQLTDNQRNAVKLAWVADGAPVADEPVTLSTSQGQFIDATGNFVTSVTVNTQPDGTATADLIASTTGAATVSATAASPKSATALTASLPVTFVGPPSKITLQAPSPIAQNGTSLVAASVADAGGTALRGVTVAFSVDAGGTLSPSTVTTDADGIARTLFTADGSSATVTVEASVGSAVTQTATISVSVPGNTPSPTLTFSSCPSKLPTGSTATCTVTLLDGGGQAIKNTAVTLTSTAGALTNSTGGTTFTTGTDGTVQFVLATTSGTQTPLQGQLSVSASAQVSGTTVTKNFDITLQPTTFAFTDPPAGAQLPVNVRRSLGFNWTIDSQAVAGATVTLTTTAGTLIDSSNVPKTSLTASTAADGTLAGIDLLSPTVGSATLTAQATDPTSAAKLSTTLQINFAGAPASFTVSAPSPIPANGTSLVSVVVSDSQGTKLNGVAVTFALPSDTPGGTLSAATVNTDTNGTAKTLFVPDGTATTTTITVTVPGLTAQTATVQIGS